MVELYRDQKGITLVEVLVSIGLITLVIVAMGAALTQSSVFSKNIDIAYTATCLAHGRVNTLKRLDFDQLLGGAEDSIRIDADGNTNPAGHYLRTTEITTDFDGNSHLTQVKVSVKRVKVNIDGSIADTEGKMTFLGRPVIMETLFADIG
ncbi:MAG: prepilin-type N-terminal cleavage/methylation domain-containing protein [Candidatus Omnitrophica bacterium]|nr:prepilin-type N-terminal cleavage/methylation domain-containing protein [Candidatus Omnitrophota bacterium]